MEIASRNKYTTRDLVETSLLIALVYLSTRFINIKLPISINGGLIHLGTGMLFISSIVFGEKKGAISGALGMGLFDLLSGWAVWAPFTFVIRGVMGFIVGKIANINDNHGDSFKYNCLAMLAGTIWNIIGYYIADGLIYGNWIAPATAIPGDLIQGLIGAIIAIPLIKQLKKIRTFS